MTDTQAKEIALCIVNRVPKTFIDLVNLMLRKYRMVTVVRNEDGYTVVRCAIDKNTYSQERLQLMWECYRQCAQCTGVGNSNLVGHS